MFIKLREFFEQKLFSKNLELLVNIILLEFELCL